MRFATSEMGIPSSNTATTASRCLSVSSSSTMRRNSPSTIFCNASSSGVSWVSASPRSAAPRRANSSCKDTSRQRLRLSSVSATLTAIFWAQVVKRLSPLKESRLPVILISASWAKSPKSALAPPPYPPRAAPSPRTSRSKRSASAPSGCGPRSSISHCSFVRALMYSRCQPTFLTTVAPITCGSRYDGRTGTVWDDARAARGKKSGPRVVLETEAKNGLPRGRCGEEVHHSRPSRKQRNQEENYEGPDERQAYLRAVQGGTQAKRLTRDLRKPQTQAKARLGHSASSRRGSAVRDEVEAGFAHDRRSHNQLR